MLRGLILLALGFVLVSLLFHRLTGRWLWPERMRRLMRVGLLIGIAMAVGSLLERLIVAYGR